MILKDKKLKYYENMESKYASGVINFDKVMCVIERSLTTENCLKLTLNGISDRKFKFKFKDDQETLDWH